MIMDSLLALPPARTASFVDAVFIPTSTEAIVAGGLGIVAGVLIAGAVALLIMCSGGCGFGS